MLRFVISTIFSAAMAAQSAAQSAPSPGQRSPHSFAAILDLIPADATAAIVIPNLKNMSDQLTHTLEAMDRSGLLMGSRPIDQAKSALGFNIGINDVGSFAIVFMGDDAGGSSPLYLVPVTDAEAFLDGNLATREVDVGSLADGTKVHYQIVGSHVALAPSQHALRDLQAGSGFGGSVHAALGERGESVLHTGEIVVVTRGTALRQVADRQLQANAQAAQLLPQAHRNAVLGTLSKIDFGLLTIDFDPLAIVVRSFASFSANSVPAKSNAGQANASSGLLSLPDKSFYFAASLDLAAIGGAETANAWLHSIGLPPVPEPFNRIQSLQFAAYPSPAGLSGGMLNNAVLIMQTAEQELVKQAIKTGFFGARWPEGAGQPQINWQPDQAVEKVGLVDKYAVTPNLPQDQMEPQLAFNILFGRAGWRGFLSCAGNSIVMTFSQRPAVLQAARESIAHAAATADAPLGLGSSAVFGTMRAWMPEHPDFEAYIGIAQLAQLLNQIAAAYSGIASVEIPQFDPDMPPIGWAADVNGRSLETALILPSAVAGVLFDRAFQGISQIDDGAPEVVEDASP